MYVILNCIDVAADEALNGTTLPGNSSDERKKCSLDSLSAIALRVERSVKTEINQIHFSVGDTEKQRLTKLAAHCRRSSFTIAKTAFLIGMLSLETAISQRALL